MRLAQSCTRKTTKTCWGCLFWEFLCRRKCLRSHVHLFRICVWHRMSLIKKASVGPTRAQQVHRIWAQKRSVGHAFFVCGDAANISARARPLSESAERNINCNCSCHNYSAQPAKETKSTILQCNSNNNTIYETAITTTAWPHSKKKLSMLQWLRIPVLFVLKT